tara:strand:+ start:6336 stop:7901 length:1566 start_codon:yes stop_codon:yes gene_type:complete
MAAITNINQSNRTIENTSSIKFRNLVAKNAIDHLFDDNQIFFFAAKSGITGSSGSSSESSFTDELAYENITVLERVTPKDVSLVVPRINYKSGIVYDSFNPYKNSYAYVVDIKGSITYNSKPYVMTSNYNVYVCIKNCQSGLDRDRVASTIEPSGIGTRPFTTADGYTWQFLYAISDELFGFLTNKWMPVSKRILEKPTTGINSAKYKQYQVQLAADTTKGSIKDLDINIGNKNVYFDSEPTLTIIGQGSAASASIGTAYDSSKGYKLTGYNISNGGNDYVGGSVKLNISPNSNSDITSKTELESLITPQTSFGGSDLDIGSDPTIALQARTLMFVGNMSQSNGSIGSFPEGIVMGSFGLISNPIYATGPNKGSIVGDELGRGADTKLNIRQAVKVQIKDNSGAGFSYTTAKAIGDSRLPLNSKVQFSQSDTEASVIDLRPYNFSGPGSSTRSNLFITGQKTSPVAGDIVTGSGSPAATFEVEQVFQSLVQVGSGNLLYIIPNLFNIISNQLYTARFIIPL